MEGSNDARALAIQVLARVRATDAYLNVILAEKLAETPPRDPRDAALCTELCYGTSRRQLTLDYALTRFASRPLTQLEDRVLAALRIGAYQLFYTRVPRRAAVAETVEALKRLNLERATGFVNAILRKLSALETPPLPPASEGLLHLAVRESHPEWLVSRWISQFGRERAEVMLSANNAAAPVVLRVNTRKTSREALLREFTEMGIDAEPTHASPVGITLPRVGRVEDVYGFSEGLWQVQDEAAQLVGEYAAIPPEARVLDACAAPGGKACHLAQSHEVVAVDLHANKLRKIRQEAERLGLAERIALFAHDATKPLPAALGRIDAALVDAPCSGLGTLRRHPELRFRRIEEDVPRIAALQGQILEQVAERIPSGGLLTYAVCTTEPEEGREQVARFLASHADFEVEPPPGFPVALEDGMLQTLPGPEGMDGFFAARLRRA